MENSYEKAKTQSVANSLNEKPIQNKANALQDNRPASLLQRKVNKTGLPNNLKSGIENLSGHSMDDVKVHYNSDKPTQLNAHAYAQGTDIHIASGQEKHLPHEAWHVVQQKQGRVKPTLQMKGKVNINDDKGLEKEADVMGAKALQMKGRISSQLQTTGLDNNSTAQAMFIEDGVKYSQNANYGIPLDGIHQILCNERALPLSPMTHFAKISEVTKEITPSPIKEEQVMENEGGKERPPIKIKFNVYQSNKKFNDSKASQQPNDCGMYANALAFEKETWGKEKRPGEHLEGMIKPSDIDKKEGNSQYDPQEEGSKDNLSLDVGDMYRMDWDKPKDKPEEKCGHHVATVVAKDGEDHITSEADAGLKLQTAAFKMYGTTENTFWQTHQKYFRADNQGPPFVSKYQNPKNKK